MKKNNPKKFKRSQHMNKPTVWRAFDEESRDNLMAIKRQLENNVNIKTATTKKFPKPQQRRVKV